jgi:hypothetical protein
VYPASTPGIVKLFAQKKPGKLNYREVSVDRNTATRTQTLK